VGTDWKTVVTAPQLSYDAAANQATFTFKSNRQENSQKYYQGSESTGTLLRTVNTIWATNGSPATRSIVLENNQQSKVDTTIDSNGNLTSVTEYAWGAGTPGAAMRTTASTYLSTTACTSRNILNHATQILVRDGGPTATVKSRTDITYDESTYLNTECPTGIAQHSDASYGCGFFTRGNPTTVTTYTSAALSLLCAGAQPR
jgi:hypothetical protein